MENKEMALKAAKLFDSKKALDIMVIDITAKSTFADYLVIASGGSERQVGTLAEELDDVFSKENLLPKNIEGKKNSGWILMDYGDVIINVFSTEQRERYNIEKVWIDCPSLNWEEN